MEWKGRGGAGGGVNVIASDIQERSAAAALKHWHVRKLLGGHCECVLRNALISFLIIGDNVSTIVLTILQYSSTASVADSEYHMHLPGAKNSTRELRISAAHGLIDMAKSSHEPRYTSMLKLPIISTTSFRLPNSVIPMLNIPPWS